jgi:uncharacterized protein
MPANLPPQYYEAEKAYRQARGAQEKIEALEQMLAIMPKHKGTDHLRGELRARIARLTEEAEKKQGGARSQLYHIPKEGAGQAALVGPPNAGKSQLMSSLTDATPKVGEYPFTTQLPMPAMMPFENILVQLVDLPPTVPQGTPPWMRGLLKQADLLLLVVDLSRDPQQDVEALLTELAALRIEPVATMSAEQEDVMVTRVPAILIGNKLDLPGADENWEITRLEYGGRLPTIAVSALEDLHLDELRRLIFERLRILRVYTKAPGKEPDLSRPVVVPAGSTMEEIARHLHKDIARNLKYAVVWGSGKFQGQRVSRQHVAADGDVVEFVE